MSHQNFWDVFKLPPPGNLPSAAPGTGPAQADSSGGQTPADPPWRRLFTPGSGKPGTPTIPKTESPNAAGYGGGPDSVLVTPQAPEGPAHGGPFNRKTLRDLLRQTPPGPAVPRYNVLYDHHASRDGWRYFNNGYASGTIVPAGTSVAATVTLAQTIVGGILARVSQYPGGIQAFLVIRAFGAAPRLTTQTGSVIFSFQDFWGSPTVALGTALATDEVTGLNLPVVCDTPITDAGLNGGTLGTLYVATGGGGTFGTWDWQMNFALAYLLPDPAFSGYTGLLPLANEAMSQEIQASVRRG